MKQSRQIKTRANEPEEEKVGEITAAGGDLKQDPKFLSLSLSNFLSQMEETSNQICNDNPFFFLSYQIGLIKHGRRKFYR